MVWSVKQVPLDFCLSNFEEEIKSILNQAVSIVDND